MAIIKTKEGNAFNRNIYEYICDTAADVADLPEDIPFGSMILIIGSGTGGIVKMKNSKGDWIEI